jgi:hypothetical protein
MSYFGAALGTVLGMMISLVVFSNAWRIKSYLPKDYDFTHEWGKKFVKTDNKKFTYVVRSFIGIILHPIIFVFIWSQEGLLKINIFNNDIISAVTLLFLESLLFSFAIWTDIVKIRPENLKTKIIPLQIGIHLLLGFLMGFFYTLL